MENFILEKRNALGYSQRKLAEIIGVKYQMVQRWENGTAEPLVKIAIALAKALNTTVEELYPLTDENDHV